RRSETGHGVTGRDEWRGRNKPAAFANHSSSETRTHNALLAPQEDIADWKSNAAIGNAMYSVYFLGEDALHGRTVSAFLGQQQHLIPTSRSILLFEGFEHIWRGIVDVEQTRATAADHKNRLRIHGIKSVTSSPFGINTLGRKFFDFMDALTSRNLLKIAGQALDDVSLLDLALLSQGKIIGLSAANSMSLGVSIQPLGIGVTFSASTSGGLVLPSYTYVNSFGDHGTITKQATR